jgi:hypothetical protein
MSAIVVKQPPLLGHLDLQIIQGLRLGRASCAFNGTDASGTLPVRGFSTIDQVLLTPLDAPRSLSEAINIPLGTISATMGMTFVCGHVGNVNLVSFICKETVAGHNDNHWTFRLTNKGQSGSGTAAVIVADSSNSTDADASPQGSSLAGYANNLLYLGATADRAVAELDVLEFTITKAGVPANLTECSLALAIVIGGTDETLHVQANSNGTIPITSGNITIYRTGNVKTNNLKFNALVIGR